MYLPYLVFAQSNSAGKRFGFICTSASSEAKATLTDGGVYLTLACILPYGYVGEVAKVGSIEAVLLKINTFYHNGVNSSFLVVQPGPSTLMTGLPQLCATAQLCQEGCEKLHLHLLGSAKLKVPCFPG